MNALFLFVVITITHSVLSLVLYPFKSFLSAFLYPVRVMFLVARLLKFPLLVFSGIVKIISDLKPS